MRGARPVGGNWGALVGWLMETFNSYLQFVFHISTTCSFASASLVICIMVFLRTMPAFGCSERTEVTDSPSLGFDFTLDQVEVPTTNIDGWMMGGKLDIWNESICVPGSLSVMGTDFIAAKTRYCSRFEGWDIWD